MIAPIYEKYSKAYKGAKYYNCDSEELVEVASMVPVSSVPTFALYKNGEIVLIVSGNGADPRKLRSGIRKYAAKDETKKPRPVTNGIKKRRRPKKITWFIADPVKSQGPSLLINWWSPWLLLPTVL